MQKITEKICAKKCVKPYADFAAIINSAMARKGWTSQMLNVRANILSNNDKEVFGYRSLQYWLSGENLPNLRATVAIDHALEMEHKLIKARVELEFKELQIEKTPA